MTKVRNFVAGRWVLTVKKDKDGNFQTCKARWVLKGFQDKQKNTQQTDSPAASRAGFRCATQLAANYSWDLYHMDLKTAFLQGEAYDETRDIICQIPPEYGYPPYIGARLKKPGYTQKWTAAKTIKRNAGIFHLGLISEHRSYEEFGNVSSCAGTVSHQPPVDSQEMTDLYVSYCALTLFRLAADSLSSCASGVSTNDHCPVRMTCSKTPFPDHLVMPSDIISLPGIHLT